jgi:glycosyltransferase involved in cell wall biosynthesis
MRAQFSGPIAALFHDALPWRFPKWSTPQCRLNHISYMRALSKLEAVAAVSTASLEDLKLFWHADGIVEDSWPQLKVVPLASGYERIDSCQWQGGLSKPFNMLMVATLEGRKNHLSLLDACEGLWSDGHVFHLRLIGGLNRRTGQAVVSKIQQLQTLGYSVEWEGAVAQRRVYEAYLQADLVLVPSLYEGFGLPVVEALSLGKPVICTRYGALEEVARDGGCFCLPDGGAESIAIGIATLLTNVSVYRRLKHEAAQCLPRRWTEVADDLNELMNKL